MAQGMNDLFSGFSTMMNDEEFVLSGFQGLICGQIIAERIKRGMSQKQFADFMGVSQGMVSKWERGDCNFTLQSLVHIAARLGIKMQSPFISPQSGYQTTRSRSNVVLLPATWHTHAYSSSSPYFSTSSYSEPKEM